MSSADIGGRVPGWLAQGRQTGQDPEESQRFLWQALSVCLMKGNAALFANPITEEAVYFVLFHMFAF